MGAKSQVTGSSTRFQAGGVMTLLGQAESDWTDSRRLTLFTQSEAA